MLGTKDAVLCRDGRDGKIKKGEIAWKRRSKDPGAAV